MNIIVSTMHYYTLLLKAERIYYPKILAIKYPSEKPKEEDSFTHLKLPI